MRAQVRTQVGVRAGVMKSNRSPRATGRFRLGFGIMLGLGYHVRVELYQARVRVQVRDGYRVLQAGLG